MYRNRSGRDASRERERDIPKMNLYAGSDTLGVRIGCASIGVDRYIPTHARAYTCIYAYTANATGERHQGRSPYERHLATTCLDALALPNFPPRELSPSMRTRSYDACMWMHVYSRMHVFRRVVLVPLFLTKSPIVTDFYRSSTSG